MVKIRLKQIGKRKQKLYRVVVIDSTKKRDGQTIEEIGLYNPLTNPSTININMEKYNSWLTKGAQPSEGLRVIVKNFVKAKA